METSVNYIASSLKDVDGPYTSPKVVTSSVPGPKSQKLIEEMSEMVVCAFTHYPRHLLL